LMRTLPSAMHTSCGATAPSRPACWACCASWSSPP
jgi:hypothetical protein